MEAHFLLIFYFIVYSFNIFNLGNAQHIPATLAEIETQISPHGLKRMIHGGDFTSAKWLIKSFSWLQERSHLL